jgi:hypothetical protein
MSNMRNEVVLLLVNGNYVWPPLFHHIWPGMMQAKHNKAISKDTWSQLFEFSRVSWSTYHSLGHHFVISSDGVHTIHIKIYSSSLVLKTRLHPQKSSEARGFFPMFETRMPDL